MTATDSWHGLTAATDELLAALQEQVDVAETLRDAVNETLYAAASVHLQACLLQRNLAQLIAERERWWHRELSMMITQDLSPDA